MRYAPGPVSGLSGNAGMPATLTVTAVRDDLSVSTSVTLTVQASVTADAPMVGSVGPGGGTIFYVAETPFACGADLTESCTYLEVAPLSGETSGLPWGSMPTDPVPTIDRGEVGTGLANTNAILDVVTEDSSASTSAAVYVSDYTNGGKTDWYLPARAELNELCKYARQQVTGDTSVACADSGTLRRGFGTGYYWSSTLTFMFGDYMGWWQVFESEAFPDGYTDVFNYQGNGLTVRPVRAG